MNELRLPFLLLKTVLVVTVFMTVQCCAYAHVAGEPLVHQKGWLNPGANNTFVGKSHGDVAVSSDGRVFLSILGEQGGIQVFSSQGQYIRHLPDSPKDIHGFTIVQESGGEYIYAARMFDYSIEKYTLEGKKILTIDAFKAIPARFHNEPTVHAKWTDTRKLRLSGIAVSEEGMIYVVDGYGRDFIHQFDALGNYVSTFAGKVAPWNFSNCHKIAIDPRYLPKRLLCTDRANNRLVHMNLDGSYIGIHAQNLRLPSAVAFYKDMIAVAEINGRVSLLDKSGATIATLGTNDNHDEIGHPRTPPEKWQDGVFTAPHGIAFDSFGSLYVTEYSNWGRVLKFKTQTGQLH